jgi:hypothetical protein
MLTLPPSEPIATILNLVHVQLYIVASVLNLVLNLVGTSMVVIF